MKLRNFFAFGFIFSLVFLLLTGLGLFLSPESDSLTGDDLYFFGLSVSAWKTQFIISFFLLVVFLFLLIIKLDWSKIKLALSKELPGKIWNTSELWGSLIVVFVLIILAGSDITLFKQITGTHNQGNNTNEIVKIESNNEVDDNLRNVSLANLTFDQIAENYQNMTGEFVISKIKDDGLLCPDSIKTLGEVALLNNYPVNEIVRIIGYGEMFSQFIRNGKPIKNRSIADASIETGIPTKHIYKIFESYDLVFSGNDDQTFANLSIANDQSPADIYGLLDNKDEKKLPTKTKNSNVQEFVKAAASMTIPGLAKVIKEQQPNADVSAGILFTRLRDNDIKISENDLTISDIAKDNNIRIEDILKIASFGTKTNPNEVPFMKSQGSPPPSDKKSKNSKALEFIQTPLNEIALKYDLKTNDMLKALKDKGVTATEGETIEQIAKNNNQRPGPIIKILREFRQKNIKE